MPPSQPHVLELLTEQLNTGGNTDSRSPDLCRVLHHLVTAGCIDGDDVMLHELYTKADLAVYATMLQIIKLPRHTLPLQTLALSFPLPDAACDDDAAPPLAVAVSVALPVALAEFIPLLM